MIFAGLLTPLIAASIIAGPPSGNGVDLLNGGSNPNGGWAPYVAAQMNDWNHTAEANAKAAGVVPFVYKDLTSTREDDCGSNPGGGSPCIVNGVICPTSVSDAAFYAGGIGFCAAWRNHPEWFLTKDGSVASHSTALSNLETENGFPNQFIMDWGNVNYQNAWASTVIADAKANGWGWVFGDNALTNPTAYTNNPIPAYPTKQAVQAATEAEIQNISAQLHGAGIGIIPNLGYTNLYPGLWASWLPFVDGFYNQHNVGSGVKTPTGNELQDEHNACTAQNKLCFFNQFTDTHGNTAFNVQG